MRANRLSAASSAAAVVVMMSAMAGAAMGGVIYDNGSVPDDGGATWYFAQLPGQGALSTEFADDFVLADGASTIRDIHWYGDALGFEPVDELDSFVLTIYSTAAVALAPGAVVTVASILSIERTAVDLAQSQDTYLYSAVVSDIVLQPGVRYWLGISGDSGLPSSPWSWRSSKTGNGIVGWTRSGSTGEFEPITIGIDAAFYLTDDIPAPGVVGVCGVMGAMGMRRRRK